MMSALSNTRYSLSVILLVGLVLRLALVVVDHGLVTLPQGGADALHFERLAWRLSDNGREGITAYLGSGAGFIALLGSYIYDLTGRAPLVLGIAMAVLGTGIIGIAYFAALELWEDLYVARAVAWAVALFPQLLLHSALFLREIPVSFCLAAAGLCAVRYIKRSKVAHAVWYACWVALGTLFHSAVIVAIPALVFGMILARPRGNRGKIKYYAISAVAAFVLIGVIYVANETGFGLGKFGGSLDAALETFEQQEGRATLGSAAFPEWMRVRGGLSDTWKIPIRFTAFLFSPLVPFLVRSLRHLLGVLDAVLYLFLLWNLWRNRKVVMQNQTAVVLLIVFLTLCLVFSLGVSNFGTAIRHRAKMSPLILLLAAGLPEVLRRRGREGASALPFVMPVPTASDGPQIPRFGPRISPLAPNSQVE